MFEITESWVTQPGDSGGSLYIETETERIIIGVTSSGNLGSDNDRLFALFDLNSTDAPEPVGSFLFDGKEIVSIGRENSNSI